MAEEARDLMQNDMSYEQGSMQNVAEYMNQFVSGGGSGSGDEPFEPGPTPEPPTGGEEMEI